MNLKWFSLLFPGLGAGGRGWLGRGGDEKTKVEEIKNLKIKSRLTTQRMHACTMKAEEKSRERGGAGEKKLPKICFSCFIFFMLTNAFFSWLEITTTAGMEENEWKDNKS